MCTEACMCMVGRRGSLLPPKCFAQCRTMRRWALRALRARARRRVRNTRLLPKAFRKGSCEPQAHLVWMTRVAWVCCARGPILQGQMVVTFRKACALKEVLPFPNEWIAHAPGMQSSRVSCCLAYVAGHCGPKPLLKQGQWILAAYKSLPCLDC